MSGVEKTYRAGARWKHSNVALCAAGGNVRSFLLYLLFLSVCVCVCVQRCFVCCVLMMVCDGMLVG